MIWLVAWARRLWALVSSPAGKLLGLLLALLGAVEVGRRSGQHRERLEEERRAAEALRREAERRRRLEEEQREAARRADEERRRADEERGPVPSGSAEDLEAALRRAKEGR